MIRRIYAIASALPKLTYFVASAGLGGPAAAAAARPLRGGAGRTVGRPGHGLSISKAPL